MQETFGKITVLKNLVWKMFERGSSLIITMGVNIVLARILNPSDFGLVAMVMVFVTLSGIFVTGGLSNSLIQKKDADELDFSSLFWLNLLVSFVLYLLIFLLSPSVSAYFGYPELKPILRVLALNLFFSAVNSVQGAYIARNMLFRHYFYSTLSGKIVSGIVGIGMALTGFGVWSLVGLTVSLLLFETLILWFRVNWRPKMIFSSHRAKELYSFAWRIMLMSFVENVSDQLRKMLIGKRYTSDDLAYYDKGYLLPTNIITNISSSLGAVMFPVLAKSQDKQARVLMLCRRWTSVFAYCVFPLLLWMMLAARPLILLLFTEKWLSSLPYMQLSCLVYVAWVIEIPIRETIKSLGNANICLRIQIIKTIFALVVLLLFIEYGVMAIAVSAAGCGALNIAVSMYYGNKYAQYSPLMLISDIVPTITLCIVMAIPVYTISLFELSSVLTIILQVPIGGAIYIGASILLKNENYQYMTDLVRGMLQRGK